MRDLCRRVALIRCLVAQKECPRLEVILIAGSEGVCRSKPVLGPPLHWCLVTLMALLSFCAQAQIKSKDRGKHPRPPDPRVAAPDEAGETIRHAYDAISRTGLLRNDDLQGTAQVDEILSQSKIAYQEALSCFQSNDYVAAREEATASADLSRALEELEVSRLELGGGATVPAPSSEAEENDHTARDLENLDYRLKAIQRRQLAGNAIPSATATLIQALILQSRHLQHQAQDLLLHGQAVRAGHTARAGDALTHAAEHIGNRYFLAAGILPVPVGPAPGPERRPPPRPVPGLGQHR